MIKEILYAKWGSLKSQMQYTTDFIIHVSGISFIGIIDICALFFLTNTFNDIGGWSFWELGFMVSLWRFSHSIHNLFFIPFWWQSRLVKTGEFDRFLVRPMHPIFQMMTLGHPLGALGEFISALILFVFTISHIAIEWSVLNSLFLIITILSGTIIEWSVFLFLSSFDFYFTETKKIREIPSTFLYNATKYPIHIFGNIFPFILTFIFPYAFISYYPSLYFFGRIEEVDQSFLPFLSPAVAVVAFLVAFFLWSRALNYYTGSGS